jgi:hypothetical protein
MRTWQQLIVVFGTAACLSSPVLADKKKRDDRQDARQNEQREHRRAERQQDRRAEQREERRQERRAERREERRHERRAERREQRRDERRFAGREHRHHHNKPHHRSHRHTYRHHRDYGYRPYYPEVYLGNIIIRPGAMSFYFGDHHYRRHFHRRHGRTISYWSNEWGDCYRVESRRRGDVFVEVPRYKCY